MAKMNGVVRTRGKSVLAVVLCLTIVHPRGTRAQTTGLNETQVSNIILQEINQIPGLGQEFAANFFTDLAPLLILFGDQVVRQYMAQSQDWADHIIFAMGPLGIATALTGAVRMCGHKFLRELIKPLSKDLQWRPCWIQKWGKADEQTFDSYLIFGSLRNTRNSGDALVTLHPRRQPQQEGSTHLEPAGHLGEREIPRLLVHLTAVACVLGIMGFFIMVAGTRSLHWSVPTLQLGQTLFMAFLRSYARRKINADDIRVVKLPRGFEMEWLVTRHDELWKKLENWDKTDNFWKPEANKGWGLVTGEKIVRVEEITQERGSITVGPTLT